MTICEEDPVQCEAMPPAVDETYAQHVGKASDFFELRERQVATIKKAYALLSRILARDERTPCEDAFCFEMKGFERKYQLRRGTVTTSGVYAVATSMRALEKNMSPIPWATCSAQKPKPEKSWAEKQLKKQLEKQLHKKSDMNTVKKTIEKSAQGASAYMPTKTKRIVLTAVPRSSTILSDASICSEPTSAGAGSSAAMPPKKRPGALVAINSNQAT